MGAYGPRRIFYVFEIDADQGTLCALRPPEHAPALRRSLIGHRRAALKAEHVSSLLPQAFLER